MNYRMGLKRRFFKRDYICPYCFDRHDIHHVKFRCHSQDCRKEEDKQYSNFYGYKPPLEMNRVIQYEAPQGFFQRIIKKMPEEIECDLCQRMTSIKICPSCHSRLPLDYGEFDELFFAVVGAKETGKSHFITVLIDQIRRNISNTYKFTVERVDDETMKRYRDDFYDPLFKEKITLDTTRTAGQDRRVQRPLLYALKFYKEQSSQQVSIERVVTLAFFDSAGEDLDDEDTMHVVNKYIYNSNGIILLLDPLQLHSVREQLQDKIRLPQINSDSDEILERMTNLIRRANRIKQNEKINIPIAVTFSKIDAVQPLLDPASPLQFPSEHEKSAAFNLADFENVQSEIEVLIADWAESGMNQTLRVNFDAYGYFGVSSLGHNPGTDNRVMEVKPYRVADPLLWLLAEHKIIKVD